MEHQSSTAWVQSGTRVRAGYWGPREETNGEGRTLRSLLGELSREVTVLARQEVALAKAELSEKAGVAARNAAYVALGGLVAYAGFLLLAAAIAAGLGAWMASADVSPGVYLWLAPLIVALVLLGAGGALGYKAITTIKNEGLTPKRTADSLRDTRQWVKEKVT